MVQKQAARELEGECQAATEAALLFGKEEYRTVVEDVWVVTLCQQIAHFKQGLNIPDAIAGLMERLAQSKVEIRRNDVERIGSSLRNGVIGLPAITCLPFGASAVEGAGERDGVGLDATGLEGGNQLSK